MAMFCFKQLMIDDGFESKIKISKVRKKPSRSYSELMRGTFNMILIIIAIEMLLPNLCSLIIIALGDSFLCTSLVLEEFTTSPHHFLY